MRLAGKHRWRGIKEGDMTPMIDMTFQLIAFFMVLINFTKADQNERIRLPTSELVKPPEGQVENPITLQVTLDGTVIYGGQERSSMEELKADLLVEKEHIAKMGTDYRNAMIIIRAHAEAKTGQVQLVIKTCQDVGFVKFALRAKQHDKEP